MFYAALLNNYVVDVKESDTIPYYPPTSTGEILNVVEGNADVKVGMTYDEIEKKFFIKKVKRSEIVEEAKSPTQLDRIEALLQEKKIPISPMLPLMHILSN